MRACGRMLVGRETSVMWMLLNTVGDTISTCWGNINIVEDAISTVEG